MCPCAGNPVVRLGVDPPGAEGQHSDCAGGQGPKTCGKHGRRDEGYG